MRKLLVTAACLVTIAACSQTTTPPPATTETPAAAPQNAAEATAQDTCGAAAFQTMIGTNIAAVTFSADANIRIVQPDTPVTEDFRPERLNVMTDANGVIASLGCY